MASIRNNPEVHAELHDPEKILTRLGHFWDAHGISKHVLEPRGPLFNKYVLFTEDSASVPDTRPNMPSGGPNTTTLNKATFNIGFEGGLTSGERHAARKVLHDNPDPFEGAEIDEFKSVIDLMSPIHVSRKLPKLNQRGRGQAETTMSDIGGVVAYHVPQSKSISDFWNRYDSTVQERRRNISSRTRGLYLPPSVHIGRLLNSEAGGRYKKEYDSLGGYWADGDDQTGDLNVMVQTKNGNTFSDKINLNTGNWARINRDQFFPS